MCQMATLTFFARVLCPRTLSLPEEDLDLWRDGYVLLPNQLPPMVDSELAAAILRCGKSIIFLRECCGDSSWAPWGGSGAGAVTKLEYGQVRLGFSFNEAAAFGPSPPHEQLHMQGGALPPPPPPPSAANP